MLERLRARIDERIHTDHTTVDYDAVVERRAT